MADTLIFMDYDGVLQTPAYFDFKPFEHLKNLIHVLEVFPNSVIAITSSHRVGKSLRDLREPYPEFLRKRVIGSTPDLPLGRADGGRHAEILAFLAEQKLCIPWVAVDDEPKLYGEATDNLHVTHPLIGLDEDSAEFLIAKIKTIRKTGWPQGSTSRLTSLQL